MKLPGYRHHLLSPISGPMGPMGMNGMNMFSSFPTTPTGQIPFGSFPQYQMPSTKEDGNQPQTPQTPMSPFHFSSPEEYFGMSFAPNAYPQYFMPQMTESMAYFMTTVCEMCGQNVREQTFLPCGHSRYHRLFFY
jgi:hypothetical protein